MEKINIGTFCVDVERQHDGKYDVWIAHDGNSGVHYKNITSEEIGRYVTEEVEIRSEHTL